MNAKEKLLVIALLLVVTLSFFLDHLWSYADCALENAGELGIAPLLVFSRFLILAGVAGIRFLL